MIDLLYCFIILTIFSSFEKYERFSYIGTKKKYHFGDGNRQEVKNLLDDIEDNFVSSLKSCLGNLTKREDLADVIGILENDPIFFNYRIGELIIGNDASIDYNDMTLFRKIFSSMSSGHKVVLSTIVRCIDKMVEKETISYVLSGVYQEPSDMIIIMDNI